MTVLNLKVSSSDDDANQIEGNTVTDIAMNTASLGTGVAGTTPHRAIGLRFQNVTIPQGTTISSATLSVRSHGTSWISVYFTWYGQAADNAAAFANNEDLTARPYTTANVLCNAENVNRADATFYTVPAGGNWGPIVQEIVNRAGWTSGNSLVLIADGNGSTNYQSFTIDMYDELAAAGATLDITYEGPVELQQRSVAVGFERGVMRGVA